MYRQNAKAMSHHTMAYSDGRRITRFLGFYASMSLIRKFEEEGIALYRKGLIRGSFHPYIGMEAGAVGVLDHCRKGDLVCTYHRGHGHCLAMGLSPRFIMAELLGKIDGFNRGHGGTMHVASMANGLVGADGVVGGMLPVAVGLGYVSKITADNATTFVFFGDGAVNQGVFHEALNLASVFSVPVVFVCENNLWALNTKTEGVFSPSSIAGLASGYGIAADAVNGSDVESVWEAARRTIERVRRDGEPGFLEIQTYRLTTHSAYSTGDPRSPEDVSDWARREPLATLRARMIEEGLVSDNRLKELDEEASAIVADAVSFALSSEPPPLSEANAFVYSSPSEDV